MSRQLIWILAGGVVVWAALSMDISADRLSLAIPRLGEFLGRMFPPDWSVWPEILKGMIETLRIAILGTFFSVLLSAGLAVLASQRLFPRLIWQPVRAFLAMIRAIPLIVIAMLMVASVGLGPLPGILAITIHATGMLAKFYAEAIDNVSEAPVSALASAGASRAQQLRWGIWPQMAPVILRDTIFRFELNLRESLVLGIVGAGGIGLYVQTYVRSFQYDKAAAVTLAIVALVLMSEFVAVIVQRKFS